MINILINKFAFKFNKKKSVLRYGMALGTCIMFFNQVQIGSYAYSTYERIAGKDRYETSLKVSSKIKSDVAVISSGASFADALSSVNISNKFGGIILLTDGKMDISSELKNRGIKKVYIVGGYSTISKHFEDILSKDFDIERIAGNDRYLTSKESIKVSGYTNIGIADGRNFPDALSATPLLNQENCGLLLVNGSKEYSLEQGMEVKYTFGGKNSVIKDGGERIFGDSRYETAIKIMEKINNAGSIAYVSGKNYADALSSTNLLLLNKTIIMPVDDTVNKVLVEESNKINKVFFIGGESSISKKLENTILGKNNLNPISLEGVDESYDIEENTKKINRQFIDIKNMNEKTKKIKSLSEKKVKLEDLSNRVEKLKHDYAIHRNNIYYKIERISEGKDQYIQLLSDLDYNFKIFLDIITK